MRALDARVRHLGEPAGACAPIRASDIQRLRTFRVFPLVELDFRIANSSRIEAEVVANAFGLGVCGFRPMHAELFETELGEDRIVPVLLSLPDTLEILPAHFAGSACGAGMSGKPSGDALPPARAQPRVAFCRQHETGRFRASRFCGMLGPLSLTPAQPTETHRWP